MLFINAPRIIKLKAMIRRTASISSGSIISCMACVTASIPVSCQAHICTDHTKYTTSFITTLLAILCSTSLTQTVLILDFLFNRITLHAMKASTYTPILRHPNIISLSCLQQLFANLNYTCCILKNKFFVNYQHSCQVGPPLVFDACSSMTLLKLHHK